MKINKLFIAIIILMGLSVACGKEKKHTHDDEVKHDHSEHAQHDDHEHEKSDELTMVKYQCPMKCEGDKTYDKAGSCPVCKMDLKELAVEEQDEENLKKNEGHKNHDNQDQDKQKDEKDQD